MTLQADLAHQLKQLDQSQQKKKKHVVKVELMILKWETRASECINCVKDGQSRRAIFFWKAWITAKA